MKDNAIAQAIIDAAQHIGNGNASTNGMGAIEGHAMLNKEGLHEVAGALYSGLESIAQGTDSLSNPLQDIAYAIQELAEAIKGLKQNES
jgi:hypothetical protein|tara:strand:- start:5 stop:271 length:267 start_codon:yes stop_codon:yes gene_type:complete